MEYVGVDISLTGTGLCTLNDKGEVVKSTCIMTKAHDCFHALYKRIDYITNAVTDFVGDAGLVFVEGYAYGACGQVFSIAELSGFIKHKLYATTTVLQIPPTVLKKYITGTGMSKKELVLKEIYKRYKVDFYDNNEADAFGLARCGYEISQCLAFPDEHAPTSKQEYALKNLRNCNKGRDWERYTETCKSIRSI